MMTPRRTVFLNLIGGASGDMLLGALVDVGLELGAMEAELARLPVQGFRLSTSRVERGMLPATLVQVDLDADGRRVRTWQDFQAAIEGSSLPDMDRERGRRILDLLAAGEAAAHGEPQGSTHLHELGTVDTLVDIMGAVVGLRLLEIDSIYSSPFPAGSGFFKSSHGVLPSPGPAALAIYTAAGAPVRTSPHGIPAGEAVTPSGAAIIASLASFGPVDLAIERTGYGAGTRDPAEYPNVLGIWLGTAADSTGGGLKRGGVSLLETNIDDMTGEMLGYVQERLFEAGALDVWMTPIQMKKNRPAVLLSALVPAGKAEPAARLIMREASTLGVRVRPIERYEAEREVVTVETSLGAVPVKVKRMEGVIISVSPEYDVCRDLALQNGLALQEVLRRVQSEAMDRVIKHDGSAGGEHRG